MNNPQCVAANMPAHERKGLAILALTKIAQVTQLVEQQDIRRQFIYRQKHMAEQAIDQAFPPTRSARDVRTLVESRHFGAGRS